MISFYKKWTIFRFLLVISFLCQITPIAIKDLSAYVYDRVMDRTNGKKKRDDPAEKESARAISLAGDVTADTCRFLDESKRVHLL